MTPLTNYGKSPLKQLELVLYVCLFYNFMIFSLQFDHWKKFVNENEISFPDLCCLVRIMISIPPNTGWVERAYSVLEITCQKLRN